MTVTSTPPAPWREVITEAALLRTGRGSMLGPDTWRRGRWWDLPLDCGHLVERTARYRPLGAAGQRGGSQRRRREDVLPAPKRVRCEQCPRQAVPS